MACREERGDDTRSEAVNGMGVTKRQILKEAKEHERLARELGVDPLWLGRRFAEDHARRLKTTTREGKRIYQKNYMRIVRSA